MWISQCMKYYFIDGGQRSMVKGESTEMEEHGIGSYQQVVSPPGYELKVHGNEWC